MFNLLISSDPESWDTGSYTYDKSRVAIEYTANEISERYKFFTKEAIEELKSFPTLFVIENEPKPSKIGYITDISIRTTEIRIHFAIDNAFPELATGTIDALGMEIDLGRWELSRTHWAIKDENVFEILTRRQLITKSQIDSSETQRIAHIPTAIQSEPNQLQLDTSKVFIVHGHDELAKLDMANFIIGLGLEPIILHQQASSGRTIIEKIEYYSNVGFGIVLYTPCDIGSKAGELTGFYRARQNVVFEHGYLIGKLSRPRVVAVVKGNIETPNDISGVVYIPMNETKEWKQDILKEMRSVGYSV
jgi:predicted nucleotide-binding protein